MNKRIKKYACFLLLLAALLMLTGCSKGDWDIVVRTFRQKAAEYAVQQSTDTSASTQAPAAVSTATPTAAPTATPTAVPTAVPTAEPTDLPAPSLEEDELPWIPAGSLKMRGAL